MEDDTIDESMEGDDFGGQDFSSISSPGGSDTEIIDEPVEDIIDEPVEDIELLEPQTDE